MNPNWLKLCSAYLPDYTRLTDIAFSQQRLPVAANFHSPSHELGLFYNAWRAYCQSPTREANTGDLYQALEAIDRASKMLWSFNLPIQLPWADRLGVLSNGLIGKITDPLGQFSIRYGIGYCGRSLEVIEHNLLLNGRLSFVTVAAQFQPIPSSPYPRGSGYDNAEQTCR